MNGEGLPGICPDCGAILRIIIENGAVVCSMRKGGYRYAAGTGG